MQLHILLVRMVVGMWVCVCVCVSVAGAMGVLAGAEVVCRGVVVVVLNPYPQQDQLFRLILPSPPPDFSVGFFWPDSAKPQGQTTPTVRCVPRCGHPAPLTYTSHSSSSNLQTAWSEISYQHGSSLAEKRNPAIFFPTLPYFTARSQLN